MWYKVNKIYVGTKIVRPVWKLEDSFSWTSLDTSKRAIDKIANIWTVTVNNSLILNNNGWTWSWNAWWPVVKTIKNLNWSESKVIVEYTCTSSYWWYVSIWWYAFNWVSESSYYKCNGNLPICLTSESQVLVTKSSTSFSWSNNAATTINYSTALSIPYTVKCELNITNRTVKVFNGSSQLASWTIPSNVNLNDWIGKPIASIHAIWWNSRNMTVPNIKITVEY